MDIPSYIQLYPIISVGKLQLSIPRSPSHSNPFDLLEGNQSFESLEYSRSHYIGIAANLKRRRFGHLLQIAAYFQLLWREQLLHILAFEQLNGHLGLFEQDIEEEIESGKNILSLFPESLLAFDKREVVVVLVIFHQFS